MTFQYYVHLLLLISTHHLNFVHSTSSETTALALVNPTPPPPLSCSSDQFLCLDGLKCIRWSWLCDGNDHCDDASDETESACLKVDGKEVCSSKDEQCKGIHDCDEPSSLRCRDGSRCVNNEQLCNGYFDCADGSDESDTWSNCTFCTEEGSVPCPGFPGNCAKVCNGDAICPDEWDELLATCKVHNASCSKEEDDDLFQCNDGSSCVASFRFCNNVKGCTDGEDERAEYCKEKGKCEFYHSTGYDNFLLPCDNDACVWRELACSAQNHTLCQDGSDMAESLCKGKCYTKFPDVEDTYRLPCRYGTKKCILLTSKCDGNADCDDGTGPDKSWDEQDCPFFTQAKLITLLLLCLAATVLCWPLFFLLSSCSQNFDQKKCPQLDFLAKTNDNKASSSSPLPTSSSSPPCVPSFLLHPALSNMSYQQRWSWQEVGEQLRIEVIFFNRDPQVLRSFLAHVEAQDAHPEIVFEAFKGFFFYLGSKGYDRNAVAFNMRQTIGQHRLAHLALKGRPSVISKKIYKVQKWAEMAEKKSKTFSVFVSFLRAVIASVSPFLLIFDYTKDLVLYLIVAGTLDRLDEGCKDTQFDCMAASGVERDLITALLVTFCLSLIITSLNSYHIRKRFFKTNCCLDLLFFIVSPLLPAVYRISHARMESKNRNKTLSNSDYQQRMKAKEKNFHSIQQTKLMEVGLEALVQIVLLSGLATFYWFVYTGPSGQSYAYFWGVALLVLKGNTALFFVNLFVSFVGPCWFYVNYTNILLHGCLNVKRKVVLFIQNLLSLLVRVLTITTAIFIPVINQWFVSNLGLDATSRLNWAPFVSEFQEFFSKFLHAVTAEVRWNATLFVGFVFIHLMLVAGHAIFYSAKFCKSMMRERLMHLVSSFWLPLPFLTRREVDRDDQKAELWFLIVLHSLENFSLLLMSRWAYSSYPLGQFLIHIVVAINIFAVFFSIVKRKTLKVCSFVLFFICMVASNISAAFMVGKALVEKFDVGVFVIDLCLVIVNVASILLSVFYQEHVKLYAGLPQNVSDLPSFGPEVSPCYEIFPKPFCSLSQFTKMTIWFNHPYPSVSRTCQLAQ